MPPPWMSSGSRRVRAVKWKLSKGAPKTEDVKQGALPVCPVAAILAALARTPVGQRFLDGMVTEYTGVKIKTTLPADVMKAMTESTEGPDYTPQDKDIISDRYFTVKFWKDEVPDTMYVEYTDGDYLTPVFMGSPNEVLWPAVIEKACAFSFGSYRELGNYKKHPVNEHWKLIVGSDPKGFSVPEFTDEQKKKEKDKVQAALDQIREAAEAAPRVPTIGASRVGAKKVTQWHGYAVLGMRGAEVELYDPAHAKTFTLSLEDFRENFQAVFFGNP